MLLNIYKSTNSFDSQRIYDNRCIEICKIINIRKKDLIQTTRIGISKAKNLRWRWYLKSSRSISKREKGDKNPVLNTQLFKYKINY